MFSTLRQARYDDGGRRQLRAFRVPRSLALPIASTSSSLLIVDRPGTSSRFATSIRWVFVALASTPPAVRPALRLPGPVFSARSSDGPFSAFCSQWSPTFSCVCFSDANAVRCARSPSPYWSTAESCVLPHVSCAFLGERWTVEGMSFLAGMFITSRGAPSRGVSGQTPGGSEKPGGVESEVAEVDVGRLAGAQQRAELRQADHERLAVLVAAPRGDLADQPAVAGDDDVPAPGRGTERPAGTSGL